MKKNVSNVKIALVTTSKIETYIYSLSTAFKLLTNMGTRPVAGTGYRGLREAEQCRYFAKKHAFEVVEG